MNPDHLSLLLQLEDSSCKLVVNLLVLLPVLLSAKIGLKVVEALKVVEQGSQDSLMEVIELLDRFLVEEDRHATEGLEEVSDLLRL